MTKHIWANLPVKDIERSRAFLDAQDFKRNTGFNSGEQLASLLFDNFGVHFFPEETFKTPADSEVADVKSGSEILSTLSAKSKETFNKEGL